MSTERETRVRPYVVSRLTVFARRISASMSRLAQDVNLSEDAEIRRLEGGSAERSFDALLDQLNDSDDDEDGAELLVQLEDDEEEEEAEVQSAAAPTGLAALKAEMMKRRGPMAPPRQILTEPPPRTEPPTGPDQDWVPRQKPAASEWEAPANFQRQSSAAGPTARAQAFGAETLPTPAFEKPSDRESFSGLALSRRVIGDSELRSSLERRAVRVLRLNDVSLQARAPGAWCAIGVLSSTHTIEADPATGKRAHERWVLSDLHPEQPSTMTVCLFSHARQEHASSGEVGGVYAVVAPKLLPARSSHAPPVCLATAADGLLRIGQAAQLGAAAHQCRLDARAIGFCTARGPIFAPNTSEWRVRRQRPPAWTSPELPTPCPLPSAARRMGRRRANARAPPPQRFAPTRGSARRRRRWDWGAETH